MGRLQDISEKVLEVKVGDRAGGKGEEICEAVIAVRF